ncbi:hypothetical protein ANN_16195 [Periplaneta americana]|uniref:Uncharacterized protein n=1 Tax=Periplaneta americana TaxID=6978 RepID=A0ABQ8SJP0_PERAM|nr:hypothetical protein ANN_16195 [Periplaneta americana]
MVATSSRKKVLASTLREGAAAVQSAEDFSAKERKFRRQKGLRQESTRHDRREQDGVRERMKEQKNILRVQFKVCHGAYSESHRETFLSQDFGNHGPDSVMSRVPQRLAERKAPKNVAKSFNLTDATTTLHHNHCSSFPTAQRAPEQNRYHTVARFLVTLAATGRFCKIVQYYPVHGHSFLPCDRDFDVIKRKLRREDRVYLPIDYTKLIAESSSLGNFSHLLGFELHYQLQSLVTTIL